jgi:hypothetical protein
LIKAEKPEKPKVAQNIIQSSEDDVKSKESSNKENRVKESRRSVEDTSDWDPEAV